LPFLLPLTVDRPHYTARRPPRRRSPPRPIKRFYQGARHERAVKLSKKHQILAAAIRKIIFYCPKELPIGADRRASTNEYESQKTYFSAIFTINFLAAAPLPDSTAV